MKTTIIISIVMAVLGMVITTLDSKKGYGIIGTFMAILGIVFLSGTSDKPKAIDVYRGNTTLPYKD